MHDNKKQAADLSKKVNIVETRVEKAEESNYAVNVALDNLEQYGRRECIEISGIPTLPIDNPKQLTVEPSVANEFGKSIRRSGKYILKRVSYSL